MPFAKLVTIAPHIAMRIRVDLNTTFSHPLTFSMTSLRTAQPVCNMALPLLLCVLSLYTSVSARVLLQANSATSSAINFVTALKSVKTADLSVLIKALESNSIVDENSLFAKVVPSEALKLSAARDLAHSWTILAPANNVLSKLLDIVSKTVAESKSTIEKEYGASFIPKVLANHFVMGQSFSTAKLLEANTTVLDTALPYTGVAVFVDAPKGGAKATAAQISFITAPNGHLPEPLVLAPLARAHLITPDIAAGPYIVVHVIDALMVPPLFIFSDAGINNPSDVDPKKVASIQDALVKATGRPLPPSQSGA